MDTIQKEISHTIEVKKSKFITLFFPVHALNEIETLLKESRQTYKDATHYCYAYILEERKKCSDDGEPSKTAGMPILNVLEKQNLDHVLCIVIRYYGGIKLGAGGLVRAYSNAAKETIELAVTTPLIKMRYVVFAFPYSLEKNIEKEFHFEIISKKYLEEITYEAYVTEEELEQLKQLQVEFICVEPPMLRSKKES